ncbi:hypothetical protein F937_03579 [Acinetobacter calcoaceticus ANC 3680]|uniref:hypothetical protein n=1 Tax=Acinetobacter calcoaceticus TaxID=471 RepID=UPI0002CE4436|nr:hypothetical protein [Acinetobacter calcoaceticus]ENV94175.1 hypothetical protein F937_03579 [Acinetobacter calcoaceticus ANC 3680]
MDYKFTYIDTMKAVNSWAKTELFNQSIKVDENRENIYFIQFLNYKNKLVTHKSRKVTFSKSFNVPKEFKKGLHNLVKDLKKGENVNPYLSKASLDASKSDGLLDAFGVKHFHLGTKIKKGFIERTGPIALAFVNEYEVFFIKITQHGHGHGFIWTDPDILEIIHRDRPDLIRSSKFTLMRVSNPVKSAEDIKTFREINVNSIIELKDGTQYGPHKNGQSLANYKFEHSNTFRLICKSLEKEIRNNQIAFELNYGRKISKIEFSLQRVEDNLISGIMRVFLMSNESYSLNILLIKSSNKIPTKTRS